MCVHVCSLPVCTEPQEVEPASFVSPHSICSEGMSRDLSGEVEKLLKSSNPYIVRKVCPSS